MFSRGNGSAFSPRDGDDNLLAVRGSWHRRDGGVLVAALMRLTSDVLALLLAVAVGAGHETEHRMRRVVYRDRADDSRYRRP
jgi:hypothetical protein